MLGQGCLRAGRPLCSAVGRAGVQQDCCLCWLQRGGTGEPSVPVAAFLVRCAQGRLGWQSCLPGTYGAAAGLPVVEDRNACPLKPGLVCSRGLCSQSSGLWQWWENRGSAGNRSEVCTHAPVL